MNREFVVGVHYFSKINSWTLIKAYIVDDDPNQIETFQILLADFCENVEVSGTSTKILDAVKKLRSNPPDVLFLDVELVEGTGFDLLEVLQMPELPVIFTTGHRSHAVEAVSTQAIGYLLKPINPDKLNKMLEKLAEKEAANAADEEIETILVPTGNGYRTLTLNSILWLEASGSYTQLHLVSGEELLISRRLKQFEEQLPSVDFFRAHHHALINLGHMHEYNRLEGYLHLDNGEKVEVARRRREELLNAIRSRSRIVWLKQII